MSIYKCYGSDKVVVNISFDNFLFFFLFNEGNSWKDFYLKVVFLDFSPSMFSSNISFKYKITTNKDYGNS